MCFDIPQIKFANKAERGIKCFFFRVVKVPRHMSVWVSILLNSRVLLRIMSSLEISKTKPTIPFAFHHELQILLALTSRDKVNLKKIRNSCFKY